MRGVFRPDPKFLATFSSLNARRFSARTEIPGDIYQIGCEVLFGHVRNSWRRVPVYARGVFRSEQKFLAIFPNLNARRRSVRTGIPGGISQFKCESFFRPEPKFLTILTNLNARCLSVRTQISGGFPQCKFEVFCRVGAKIPGCNYQFDCEALFGQNRNPWRYLPIRMRGVCRSEPKPLATFNSLNARRLSVRTKTPGGIAQFKCEGFYGQNRNHWRRSPVLGARRFSVRTRTPRSFYQFGCDVLFGQNRNSWQ